ncbi:hypothetical protein N7467_011186 [Penicillium canescens]|nr:hypothetical protein N7467_011186 [Penicillium canescens]
MIDESLPTFFVKNNSKQSQISTVYHRQHGNDPEPAYSLRALDPALPTSKNRYGVALYDPYVTDVVYGEVAVVPEWTQPSLSADTIRANGGAPPPPEPILPTEFMIQLYNPDQEITVKYKAKTWNRPARWEFEMPQNTFRVPSGSSLDQMQSDPATADVTEKLRFSWRKDGKLSKDLTCLLHGKTSTIPDTRTKSREPDITVALFQGLKELTLYEPNLYRVEMEDFKGLEVVLLLATVAIKDIFFGPAKEAFHITPGGPNQIVRKPAAAAATTSASNAQPAQRNPQAATPGPSGLKTKPSPPRLSIPNSSSPAPQERRRQDELARQEEQRRAQEVSAAKQRRRDAEVDKETKRLQQIYGREEEQARMQHRTPAPSSRPHLPPRHTNPPQPYSHQYSQSSAQLSSQPRPSRHSRPHSHYPPQGAPIPTFANANNPYLHAPGRMDPRAQSSTHLMQSRPQQPWPQPRPQSTVGFYAQPTSSGALPASKPAPKVQQKKSSFFGFRRNKEETAATKLEKKRSSMF